MTNPTLDEYQGYLNEHAVCPKCEHIFNINDFSGWNTTTKNAQRKLFEDFEGEDANKILLRCDNDECDGISSLSEIRDFTKKHADWVKDDADDWFR